MEDGTAEVGDGDADDPFEGLRLDEAFVAGARRREESADERAARPRRMDADLRRIESAAAPARRRAAAGTTGPSRRVMVTVAVIVGILTVAGLQYYRSEGRSALATGGFDAVFGRTVLEADQGERPPPATGVATRPLGRPAPLPGESGPYAFLAVRGDGEPARYDPCRTIRIVVNEENAPPGSETFLARAIAHTSEMSGLRFEVEGTTDEAPDADRAPYLPERYPDRWAPVLVAWTDPSRVPELEGDIAGIGGSVPVTAADGSWVYVSGLVALDGNKLSRMLAMPAGEAYVVATLAHELGHLVGLDHVDDPGELMHVDNVGRTGFGPGDRAGLAELGSGDCHPDL